MVAALTPSARRTVVAVTVVGSTTGVKWTDGTVELGTPSDRTAGVVEATETRGSTSARCGSTRRSAWRPSTSGRPSPVTSPTATPCGDIAAVGPTGLNGTTPV